MSSPARAKRVHLVGTEASFSQAADQHLSRPVEQCSPRNKAPPLYHMTLT